MSDSVLIAHIDTSKITRQDLALLPTPAGTETHKVIPHIDVVNAIVECLGFRHIAVHRDEVRRLARRQQDVWPDGT